MRKRTLVVMALFLATASVSTAEAGFFGRLWELEKKKNAWIMRNVFRVGRKKPVVHYHTPPAQQPMQYREPEVISHPMPEGMPSAPPAVTAPAAPAPPIEPSEAAPNRALTRPQNTAAIPPAPAVR
ncbi:hypothetical protein [Thalassoroseus pseudoceratinae]|uniref:hypothetical protein n=1 Tax=Thalassoroseus pseudoceratinae TaxID=2713176 RepID=UPI00141ED517|nr:hypothetical protein [Thalassoroseus pseudoceratinae]